MGDMLQYVGTTGSDWFASYYRQKINDLEAELAAARNKIQALENELRKVVRDG